MNIARLFAMGVGVALILVILEGFRRQITSLGLPREKAVLLTAGSAIGLSVSMYGFRELLSGIWLNGVVWMSVGFGFNYIVIRELWQTEAWQKRVKGVKPLTPTGRLMYLLGLVLLALLIGIILLLSGRSDFSW